VQLINVLTDIQKMGKKIVKINNDILKDSKNRVIKAAKWLCEQNTNMRILIKLTKNLGDTLHVTPIARHYKTVYPDCKIAFIVGNAYLNVHEHNKDFDMIMPINSAISTHDRIRLGNFMVREITGIDKILCPSIHPFGEVWDSHTWSYPQISHQYFHNGHIRPPESIEGGGRLCAPVTEDDRSFAKNFVNGQKCIALEYHSYSHPVGWRVDKFKKFSDMAKRMGYHCISFAGKSESIIPGTVDGRGMPWRKTIAILSLCDYMVGVGSGITMLACCANKQPKIIEIGVSESILMKKCGYTDNSIDFKSSMSPEKVIEYIAKEDDR